MKLKSLFAFSTAPFSMLSLALLVATSSSAHAQADGLNSLSLNPSSSLNKSETEIVSTSKDSIVIYIEANQSEINQKAVGENTQSYRAHHAESTVSMRGEGLGYFKQERPIEKVETVKQDATSTEALQNLITLKSLGAHRILIIETAAPQSELEPITHQATITEGNWEDYLLGKMIKFEFDESDKIQTSELKKRTLEKNFEKYAKNMTKRLPKSVQFKVQAQLLDAYSSLSCEADGAALSCRSTNTKIKIVMDFFGIK